MDCYRSIRRRTVDLCAPLTVEDHVVQSMPDASPARWHLAHTTWFFETFVLAEWAPGHRTPEPLYHHLFNSYYNGVGEPFARPRRGTLSRPTVAEVLAWRRQVDDAMSALLEDACEEAHRITEVGLQHEQQHQELLLTDVKHAFASNPLKPVYDKAFGAPRSVDGSSGMTVFPGARVEIGHSGDRFAWDNEGPAHQVLLRPYALAAELVSNREYLAFVEAGGYRDPALWLSDGWDTLNAGEWVAPLYWWREGDAWWTYTLAGAAPVDLDGPATHISFYEASAYASWRGRRLPTEAEWEHAMRSDQGLAESAGTAWEWTRSSYGPYPGYRPYAGALGEYNGKFMCNQFVLRGGSNYTPEGHARLTYRNFFAPDKRWQLTGIRLADD